jgi:hypothetical protein
MRRKAHHRGNTAVAGQAASSSLIQAGLIGISQCGPKIGRRSWTLLETTLRHSLSSMVHKFSARLVMPTMDFVSNTNSAKHRYADYSLLAQTSVIHRATPLCKGLVDLTAHIEQTEAWSPKEHGTITVSVNDDLR